MLSFRKACLQDIELYFHWANDSSVREHSYNSKKINLKDHRKWFVSKLNDEKCNLYLFENNKKQAVGQVRIQKNKMFEAVIGISIDQHFRGRGFSKIMLKLSTDSFLNTNPNFSLNAYIKEINLNSKYAFENAGFKFSEIINYDGIKSFHYVKMFNASKK
jgi:RimJ/RimL family protein N-acetyltransferase